MFVGFEILDPRLVANATNKYTFFLPTLDHINAIGNGDLVKVWMRAIPASEKWDSERVWVRVLSSSPDCLIGTLESDPFDIPGLARGAEIHFLRTHVMNISFRNAEVEEALAVSPRREYWERCLVDQIVLDGDAPVHLIWREQPTLTKQDDRFADSGWRIRGDMRGTSEEQLQRRKVAYVALGAVLNRDDSWLGVIDEPVGVTFERDFQRGVFVRVPE
jgi:hypothetical protein